MRWFKKNLDFLLILLFFLGTAGVAPYFVWSASKIGTNQIKDAAVTEPKLSTAVQAKLNSSVTGTGTAGNIPIFTGTSILGDSIISDSAGIIIISGSLQVDSDFWFLGTKQLFQGDALGGLYAVKYYIDPPDISIGIGYRGFPTYTGIETISESFRASASRIFPIINTGHNNLGNIYANVSEAIRNNNDVTSDDSGILNTIGCLAVGYGHHNENPDAQPQTTIAYGLKIFSYLGKGTIQNMFDIHISEALTGGTVTNRWGIYQQNTATNYLAGRLWLGLNSSTTSDTYILELPNSATKKALANAWDTYASSVQWKTDIAKVANPLGKLSMLDGITFRYSYPDIDEPVYEIDNAVNTKEDMGRVRQQIGTVKKPHPMNGINGIGISAEDLDKLGIPGVTQKDKNGEYVSINLTNLIPILVESVKELNKKVNALETRLLILERINANPAR